MSRTPYSERTLEEGGAMSAEKKTVFAAASEQLRKYLNWRYGVERPNKPWRAPSPWKTVGISPSEPKGVADQLLTNGSYFTCYASAATCRLLDPGLDVTDEELGRRRRTYVELFYNAQESRQKDSRIKTRDQRGKIKQETVKDTRKDFYDKWVFPCCSSSNTVEGLRDALDASSNNPLAGEWEQAIVRMLDEVAFYQELRQGDNELARECFEEDLERYLLDCQRVLLPICVYTQCLHASASDPMLPLNLYTIDFWACDPPAGTPSVRTFVEQICTSSESEVPSRLIDEYRETALSLFEQCVNDAAEVEEAFDKHHDCDDTPSVRELFEQSLWGEWKAPEWARRRGELIGMVLRAIFVGLRSGLERELDSGFRGTADEFLQDEGRLGGDALGKGSGYVPMSLRIGGEELSFPRLDLRCDVPDGVVHVLGRAYGSGHWDALTRQVRNSLSSPWSDLVGGMLDASDPASLVSRLRAHAEGYRPESPTARRWLGDYADLRTVSSGGLDVAGLLQRALEEELPDSLTARAWETFGECLGATKEVLQVAVRRVREILEREWAAERTQRLEEERARIAALEVDPGEKERLERDAVSRSRKRPPAIWDGVRSRLSSIAEKCFDDLVVLRDRAKGASEGERSGIDVLLDSLEDAYAVEHAHDPSLRFALSQLRKEWADKLAECVGASKLGPKDLASLAEKVFKEASEKERGGYLELSAGDVSGRHAVLFLEEGVLRLADVGSLHGTAVLRGEGEAFVLEGSGRTRTAEMCSEPWMPAAYGVVPTVALRRGDVVRLAGATAIVVGNRL